MFSQDFYKDLYSDLKDFFTKRKANKYRSSNNNGGTDTQEQVVEDIENTSRENHNQSGVLGSNTSSQDIANNIDIIDLSGDTGNATIPGSIRTLLKEVLTKITRKKRDVKKKKELDEEVGIDEELVASKIEQHKNIRKKQSLKSLEKLIHKVAARQAAARNISRQAQELTTQEAVKNALKEGAKKNIQEKDLSRNAKKASENIQKKSHEQAIGHFKNDLGSSSKLNPLGALADSAIKSGSEAAQLRSSVALKGAEAASKSKQATPKDKNWADKVHHQHDVSKDGGRAV